MPKRDVFEAKHMSSRFQTAMRDNVRMSEVSKKLVQNQQNRTDYNLKMTQDEIDKENKWFDSVLIKSPDYDWQGSSLQEITEMVKVFNKTRMVSSKETRKRNKAIDLVLKKVDFGKSLVEQLEGLKLVLMDEAENRGGKIGLFSVVDAVCKRQMSEELKREKFEIWEK